MKKENKKIVVVTSGGFDPIHIGHVRLLKAAKRLGDELVVILNNDNWLKKKKGFVFIPQEERKEIIGSIKYVDRVIFSKHGPCPKDMSICADLENLKPDIFAKGGDRVKNNMPVPELATCKKINCKLVFNVGRGGKVQSSSWLIKKLLDNKKINKN